MTRCLPTEIIAVAGVVVAGVVVAGIVVVEVAGAEAIAKLRFAAGCPVERWDCLATERGRLLETSQKMRAGE